MLLLVHSEAHRRCPNLKIKWLILNDRKKQLVPVGRHDSKPTIIWGDLATTKYRSLGAKRNWTDLFILASQDDNRGRQRVHEQTGNTPAF